MKKSKITMITAAVAAAVMALGACGSANSSSSSSSASTDAVITAYGSEPENPLIPANTNENGGGRVIQMLFAGLVGFDANGNAKNEVAKSIKANDDNTQYSIELNSGWKFTDGTPVTSESFTKAWSYSAIASHQMLNNSWYANIKGYDALQQDGVADDAQLEGLKVQDDTHFTVELTEASSTFPIQVGYVAFSPLPESFYKDPKAFGENPVGNGQYKFSKWTHNQSIELVKNPDYKGSFPAKNGGITFKIYSDVESAYADVQAGNLDVLDTVPASATSTFESDSSVQPYNKPGAAIQTLIIPTTLEHFGINDEGRLRRAAISRAINREQITDKVLGGTGVPAVDFLSPQTPGYSEDLKGNDVLKYNADEAKKLWAQADAIAPYGDTQLNLYYNADGGHKEIFEAYANSIKNALGINVAATPIATFQEMRQEVNNRTLKGAWRGGWMPDYPSAENYLKPLYGSAAADGNGANDGDYKNPEFDALLVKAAAASSTDDANKIYQQAEEILLKDLPVIPIYNKKNVGVSAQGVKGFAIAWNSYPDFLNITK
ncbi:ABC transporter substrate-binding protein [Alloscardovia macacae]|uniref:ABC transporter substrate-binding protein n=1 Tax=Alloscardovia macacae TaxID=1160091 RepID=A0A1Y2SXR1_9BIFI|nr:ABC transporter substrate-binding protein [Alloscardovia macacae]OTA26384.1 ABC transporter substrate-binding protein [Alloscardovia macacae]OTA28810.1 ABC transporter substrate-binding protein [Alloscardovia macacae]